MRIKQKSAFIIGQRVLLRISNGLFLAILVGVGAQAALGSDFWEKKDYTKWSEKECRKMLTNSPWAKQYVLTERSLPRDSNTGYASKVLQKEGGSC
jgi:hypothetical protein